MSSVPIKHLEPCEHMELAIGRKMDPMEIARFMTALQKLRPEREYYIDGTHRAIMSRPRRS